MFSISKIQEAGFSLYQLGHQKTGTRVAVIPACGAILHSFSVQKDGADFEVIDSYLNKEEFDKEVAGKGFKSCKLSPFACRINKGIYQWEETTYKMDKYILNGNALHGLLYDVPFEVTDEYADEHMARITMRYHYTGNEHGYPFQYDCYVSYELHDGNELRVITAITNKDNRTIPMQDGWHPYFQLHKPLNELEFTLRSEVEVVFDAALIPTGELRPYHIFHEGKLFGDTRYDHCFRLTTDNSRPAVVLRDPANGAAIEIWAVEHYPYIQLYTPDHRNSMAIECLSAPPDMFNNKMDLLVLKPHESRRFEARYIVKV